jgi:DNA helicase-2/ATP-dependent DNA helicase PcrA
VADVERTLLLDVETMARPGPTGRAHLDAFADVVADFAAGADVPSLPGLLDYLETAEQAEEGLTPGEVEVAPDRVQILTVHAAKGLEWEVVAVPHLVAQVFPGRKMSGSWLKDPAALPVPLRGDADDLPGLHLPPPGADRKQVETALDDHDDALDERRLAEERRLFYVALTRSERVLLVSGHRWPATGEKPKEPSVFLTELAEILEGPGGSEVGVLEQWAPPPELDTGNPALGVERTAQWPPDPFGDRADDVRSGADLVRTALRARRP